MLRFKLLNNFNLIIPFAVLIAILSFLIHEIIEYDIWWHLVIGNDIIEKHTIPTQDLYTAAAYGRDYHDSHWIFQIGIAFADKILGMFGVELFMICIWIAVFFAIWNTVRKWLSPGYAAILIFLAAMASVERFLPRPEIITYLMIVLFNYYLQNDKISKRKEIIVLGVLQVIWSNSHGLFVIGPFMVGCYVLSDLLKMVNNKKNNFKYTVLLFSVIIAASLLTPWNVDGWKYAFLIFSETGSNSASVFKLIGELSPTFGVATRSGYAFWFFCVLILLTSISIIISFKSRKINIAGLLILIGMFAAACTGRRNIALFALVAVPFIAECNAKLLPFSFRRSDYVVYLVTLMLLLWTWVPLSGKYYEKTGLPCRAGFGSTPSFFPFQLKTFLKKINFRHQIYNSNIIGGFYLYQNYPDLIPLTDGRWEIYDQNILKKTQEAPASLYLLQELKRKYNIKGILLQHVSPEANKLVPLLRKNTEWRLVYFDYSSSFWLSNDDSFYLNVPEISVDKSLQNPPIRIDDGIMLETFLEAMHSIKGRLINLKWIYKFDKYQEQTLEKMGRLYLESRQNDKAEETLRELLQYNSDNIFALNELSYIVYLKGNTQEAISLLEHILKIDPNNVSAVENLKRITN